MFRALGKIAIPFRKRFLFFKNNPGIFSNIQMRNLNYLAYSPFCEGDKKHVYLSKQFENEQNDEQKEFLLGDEKFLQNQILAIKSVVHNMQYPIKLSRLQDQYRILFDNVSHCIKCLQEDMNKDKEDQKASITTKIAFIHPLVMESGYEGLIKMEALGLQSQGEMSEFRNIMKLIKSDFLVQSILQQFNRFSPKTRSWVIKFIFNFHCDNEKILNILLPMLKNESSKIIALPDIKSREFFGPGLVRYWFQILKLLQKLNKNSNDISKEELSYVFTGIYFCLPAVPIKCISIFVSTFTLAENLNFPLEEIEKPQQILQIIRKRIPTLRNDNERIFILKALNDLVSRNRANFDLEKKKQIKEITLSLFEELSESISRDLQAKAIPNHPSNDRNRQKGFFRSRRIQEVRLNGIQTIFQSFRILNTFDPQLHERCELYFFKHLPSLEYHQIKNFLQERLTLYSFLLKRVRKDSKLSEKRRKERLDKNMTQHKQFTVKLAHKLHQQASYIRIYSKINFLYISQTLKFKSNEIVEVLKQLQKKTSNDKQRQYAAKTIEAFKQD